MARKPRQTATKKTKAVEAKKVSPGAELAEKKEAVVEEIKVEQVQIEEPVSIDHNYSRCGGALRKARETQGLSINDVVSQLRLSSKQVEALEADDFSELPETMIVKGFIRNYAKLLKIPAGPLLDAYAVIVPDAKQHSLIIESTIDMKFSEPKKIYFKHYVWVGLVALLAVGVWLFYQSYIQKPSSVVVSEILSESFTDMLPQVVLPASEKNTNEATTQIELPEVIAAAEPTSSSADEVDRSIEATAVVLTEAADKSNITTTLDLDSELTMEQPQASGKSRLEFYVTQETWVSVVNASGNEIYNKVLFAGNHEVIDVWPPVSLVVGNAHGATLKVNGDDRDLAPYTRINVARIQIVN